MPATNTRADWRAGVLYESDATTGETVFSAAPFQFVEDFVGAGHSAGIPAAGSPVAGYPWVKKITGAAPPTLALVANAAGGQVAAALTVTNEAQEATLYFNDLLSIDTRKPGMAEFRAALSVAPSAAGVQGFAGLGSGWVGGPQNTWRYLGFGWTANNSLLLWSKDGFNVFSISAAPIGGAAIATDTNFHIYRVDWSNVADVAFYVDGARVNTVGSITWAASGGNAVLQPYATAYKTASAGVATLTVDKIEIFNGR